MTHGAVRFEWADDGPPRCSCPLCSADQIAGRRSGHDEVFRQLRAARDGRYLQNESGRYVIAGDERRPDRKIRERLLYASKSITWRFDPKGMMLTDQGRTELESMETRR